MNKFQRAILLLAMSELQQITSAELRAELADLIPQMKADLEGLASGTDSTPATPGY
jgi:hypothetical protein